MEQRRHEEVEARIEQLANTRKPGALVDALHELSEGLLKSGYPRELLLEDLKRLVLDLRAGGRSESDDDVLEVLDVLTGWCAPSARL